MDDLRKDHPASDKTHYDVCGDHLPDRRTADVRPAVPDVRSDVQRIPIRTDRYDVPVQIRIHDRHDADGLRVSGCLYAVPDHIDGVCDTAQTVPEGGLDYGIQD